MEALTQPDVILTHESDLDGFVAGHLLRRLAKHLFQAEVRLEAWNTQAWKQRPLKEKAAWVCDFSFEPRLDRPQWLIIDHHPTDLTPKSARLIHDPGKSAALLCYDLCRAHGLHNESLDRLVHLTDVGDLFRESHPDFQLAQDYAALIKTYQFWNLSKLLDGNLEPLLDHPLLGVIKAKREIEDPLGLSWSRQRITEVTSDVAWVDIAVGNANLIVHALLNQEAARYRVLATLVKKGSAGIVVSLRSRGGEALGIAQKLQGGGHPNAAGATLPRSVQSIPDALEYLRRVLSPEPVQLAAFAAAPAELSLDV